MLIVLLIFGLSLLPALVSAVITLRTQNRLSADLSRAMEAASQRGLRALLKRDRDLNYVEGIGYIVGDLTCEMNARSPHLRCALNPCGPCHGCVFYEEIVVEEPKWRVPATLDACPLPPMPSSCPWPRVPAYAA